MRRLIVSPHPDDAEIGLGPAIAMWSREGDSTTVLVCTGEGDLEMVHSGDTIPFSQRVEEQESAARLLGAAVRWGDVAPASRFDSVPQAAFVSLFDQYFKSFDEVYVPLPSYNRDHTIVHHAALAAARPGKMDGARLYAYEQPCSNVMADPVPTFGRVYLEVQPGDVDRAGLALMEHLSQLHGRADTIYGPDALQSQAVVRGLEAGVPRAVLTFLLRSRVLCN